jgi:2-methylisocitrate lyase-like PEP mutase family enzyme
MPTVDEKRRAFRVLHAQGCFVIPNPWDVGTARWLQHLGFPALATTSAGLAFSRGLPDASLGREEVLAHVRELAAAVDVPLNADLQSGHGAGPVEVEDTVRRAVEAGVAGLSIEDGTGDPAAPLLPVEVAAERVRAARRAIDRSGADVLLTGRAECFFVGRPDLEETLRRLRAYAAAGADVLFAPGIRTREEIAAVVAAAAPRPVNVLVASASLTVAEVASVGVRRISVGSALARAAFTAFQRAAADIAGAGRFGAFGGLTSYAELDAFFREDVARRGGIVR